MADDEPHKMGHEDKQIKINTTLDILKEYWLKNPDLRLGQIISNVCSITVINDVFYLPDSVIAPGLEALERNSAREEAAKNT